MTDAEREQVIRECIAALPDTAASKIFATYHDEVANLAFARCHAALEALLPKQDPAEVLVDQYAKTYVNSGVVAQQMDDELAFARWLIESGKVEVKG